MPLLRPVSSLLSAVRRGELALDRGRRDRGSASCASPEGLCPACRAPTLRALLETSGPIHTSKLLSTREAAIGYPRGSITLAFCETCGLITNTSFVAPTHDYSASYEETQLFSARFQEYAHWLATTLAERHGLAGTEVLEIGCGRADFLLTLCETADCGGVGSTRASARAGSKARPPTGFRSAAFLAEDVDRPFSLVVCRHTLEHVHDVHDFLTRLRSSLAVAPQTPVVFEVPDVGRILRETAFWDVFYEHVTYFTPGSLARSFRVAGLRPTNLELGFDDQYILLTAGPDVALEADALRARGSRRGDRGRRRRLRPRLGVVRRPLGRRLLSAVRRARRCVIWGPARRASASCPRSALRRGCVRRRREPGEAWHVHARHRHGIVAPAQLPKRDPEPRRRHEPRLRRRDSRTDSRRDSDGRRVVVGGLRVRRHRSGVALDRAAMSGRDPRSFSNTTGRRQRPLDPDRGIVGSDAALGVGCSSRCSNRTSRRRRSSVW